jgi:hypothetical protein
MIAFVGAPLLLLSDLAVFFGVYENVSPLALVAAFPIALFEFSFGVYLVVKGFKSDSPLLARPSIDASAPAQASVPLPAPRTGDPDSLVADAARRPAGLGSAVASGPSGARHTPTVR